METRWIIGICVGVFVILVLAWMLLGKKSGIAGRYQITGIISGQAMKHPPTGPPSVLVIESTGGNGIKIYEEQSPALYEVGTQSGSGDIELIIPPESINGMLGPTRGKRLSVINDRTLALSVPSQKGEIVTVSLGRV